MRTKRDELLETIHTLECFYYLIQSFRDGDEGHKHIRMLRRLAAVVPKKKCRELITDIRKDIGHIRRETGCRLSDEQIRRLVQGMATGAIGYVNLPKWYIERHVFKNYAWVFPRWPHVPVHALVQYDTRLEGDSPYSILVVEGMLFDDAEVMWRNAVKILGDGLNFRSRPKEQQRELQTFLRATLTGAYRFLEAYLNGLAYDCFMTFHDTMDIADHDLLAEWDSKARRIRYVPFERKLGDYPRIYGKHVGKTVDLSADADVDTLLGEGKVLRDSLTHASPFVDPKTRELKKVIANIAIKAEEVKQIFLAASHYVQKVESALGRDPSRSVPWLQFGFLET